MKTELSQKLESKMLEMLIVNSYPSSCYHFSASRSRPRLLSTQTTLGKGLLSRQKSSRYIMFSEEEP